MNIYVGNLPRETKEEDLRSTFGEFGEVESVTIIKDKYTGESRQFGFIVMPNQTQAEAAINDLNGKDFQGISLKVNEAKPKRDFSDRSRGGSGGGGGGGRRFGSGGGGGGYNSGGRRG